MTNQQRVNPLLIHSLNPLLIHSLNPLLIHSLNLNVQLGELGLVDDSDGIAEFGDDASADSDLVLPQGELLPGQHRHRRGKCQSDCRLKNE